MLQLALNAAKFIGQVTVIYGGIKYVLDPTLGWVEEKVKDGYRYMRS